MPPAHLHVIGLSAGSVSGYCALTVPRDSIFGYARPEFITRRAGEFHGPETKQAIEFARLVRAIQGLDYQVGPAVIVEDADDGELDAEDLIQFRIGAMLTLLREQKQLGDASILFQSNELACDGINEKKLRRLGLLYNKDYVNDAVMQALTALRRARDDFEFAKSLWPYRAGIDDEIWE
jgi:hypothetical protein